MKAKQALEVSLGIVTSIGGYLDVGSLATSAQAGALFGFAHLWVVALGTICVIFLVEMSGRFAAVSKHTIRAAMRERLGANYFVWTFALGTIVNVLLLGAEMGGICIALQLVSGVSFHLWAVPVALVVWATLWFGDFGIIENGVTLLGLVAVAFLVGAFKAHPPVGEMLRGFIPQGSGNNAPRYWFIAVSIIGSIIAPFMLYFYSSGAVEDKWDESHLGSNRAIAVIGMGFGSVLSMGVLVCAAMVLHSRNIGVDQYHQVALILAQPIGRAGFWLFIGALAMCCFGACMEIALSVGYDLAQGLGWNWGENVEPRAATRFVSTYTIAIAVATIPIALGVDPLALTIFTMALTALILPMAIPPFLSLMNDRQLLGSHTNHRLANVVVLATSLLAGVLAIVTIPLEYFGG